MACNYTVGQTAECPPVNKVRFKDIFLEQFCGMADEENYDYLFKV